MKEVNEHVKEVMGVTPKKKVKKDYTRAIVWTVLGAVTVTLWSLIYYLFNY
jgi:hypothetical protein